MAINCRVEIFHFLDKENCQLNKNMGCTDIFLFTQSSVSIYFICIKIKYVLDHFFLNKLYKNLIVHNEDSSPAVYNTCYIVTCKIASSYYEYDFLFKFEKKIHFFYIHSKSGILSPSENFTTYCYPVIHFINCYYTYCCLLFIYFRDIYQVNLELLHFIHVLLKIF